MITRVFVIEIIHGPSRELGLCVKKYDQDFLPFRVKIFIILKWNVDHVSSNPMILKGLSFSGDTDLNFIWWWPLKF